MLQSSASARRITVGAALTDEILDYPAHAELEDICNIVSPSDKDLLSERDMLSESFINHDGQRTESRSLTHSEVVNIYREEFAMNVQSEWRAPIGDCDRILTGRTAGAHAINPSESHHSTTFMEIVESLKYILQTARLVTRNSADVEDEKRHDHELWESVEVCLYSLFSLVLIANLFRAH